MNEVSYTPLLDDMTWSYSRIKTFFDCPYKWYLQYIRLPGHIGTRLYYAEYGKFVHELLADFYRGVKSKQEIRLEYITEYNDRVSRYAEGEPGISNRFIEGLTYIDQMSDLAGQPLSVEGKINFSIGNHPCIGFIDLLYKDNSGNIILTDHKSKVLKQRNTRKHVKSNDELNEYLRQLYFYSKSVHEQYGVFPSELHLNCFRGNVVIKESFCNEEYNRAIQWAEDGINRIYTERDFRPNVEYFKCKYLCEFQDQCEYYEMYRR